MGARRAEVNVKHKDGDNDGARDQDHGEEQILADKRGGERSRWIDLCHQEKKNIEGIENGDAHGNLFP